MRASILALAAARRSLFGLKLAAPQAESQLHQQQLLIDEPMAGLLQPLFVGGRMNLAQCFGDGRQPFVTQECGGQDFFDGIGTRIRDTTDDAAHGGLCESFGQRVDRHDATVRRSFARSENLDARMGHRPSQSVQSRLARQENALTDRELLPHVRLVEPQRTHELRLLTDQHSQHGTARAGVLFVDLFDLATYAGRKILLKLLDAA